jgi:hypothetical protein
MKKIRVQLQGGLGNQLFIWAMAHEITLSTGKKVQLDYVKDRYQRKDRPIEIEKLIGVCNHEISINQTHVMGIFFRLIDKISAHSESLSKTLKKVIGVYDCKASFETPNFTSSIPRIVRGYFQTTEMVDKNKVVLEKEINSVLELEHSTDIVDKDLVLHIRRGDTRKISKNWGVLSVNYYRKQVDTSIPLIISIDDINEIENLRSHFPNATFLSPENTTTWQTLKILSEARTLIIANSTLSWWAAWLKSKRNPNTIFFPDIWRPGDQSTFEYLRIDSALIAQSDFEV